MKKCSQWQKIVGFKQFSYLDSNILPTHFYLFTPATRIDRLIDFPNGK